MKDLVLVMIVFTIGFGWGAATMLYPTYRKLREVVELQRTIIEFAQVILNDNKMIASVTRDLIRAIEEDRT